MVGDAELLRSQPSRVRVKKDRSITALHSRIHLTLIRKYLVTLNNLSHIFRICSRLPYPDKAVVEVQPYEASSQAMIPSNGLGNCPPNDPLCKWACRLIEPHLQRSCCFCLKCTTNRDENEQESNCSSSLCHCLAECIRLLCVCARTYE